MRPSKRKILQPAMEWAGWDGRLRRHERAWAREIRRLRGMGRGGKMRETPGLP